MAHVDRAAASVLVNLGCGGTYHPAWRNFDIHAVPPHVEYCDLAKPLPLADASVDVIYHSHVIEHLDREHGRRLIRECARCLRPGGILRVAAPDLEGIARHYLAALDAACAAPEDVEQRGRHAWAVVEMVDQLNRDHSGGLMKELIGSVEGGLRDHILHRIGYEARAYRETRVRTWRERLFGHNARYWVGRAGAAVRRARIGLAAGLTRLVAGGDIARALRVGVFRRSGEVHRWMYDRYSLPRLLAESGFRDIELCSHCTSQIPEFEHFGLDARDGRPRKPDSFYVEARRDG